MTFWEHLYMGDRAARARARVLRGIREGKAFPDTYVITLPESGNHIFDILPAMLLLKEERREGLLVLGVARGYAEACRLVRDMVDAMYRATGAFDWNAYMAALAAQKNPGREDGSRSAGDRKDADPDCTGADRASCAGACCGARGSGPL